MSSSLQNSSAHEGLHATASKEEIKEMSDGLARSAHLIQPLPAGQDIAMRPERFVVGQLSPIQKLAKPLRAAVWSRFCADHLRTLVTNFLTLDRQRQERARQVLLLLLTDVQPDNPYLLKFLRTPSLIRSFPKAAAKMFLCDHFFHNRSTAAHLATLFCTLIVNCEDSEHGDGKACIGAELRASLRDSLMAEINAVPSLGGWQRVSMEHLVRVLVAVDNVPGYVNSVREHRRKVEAVCASGDCDNARGQLASLTCSRCRTVVYCSQACQLADWARGHKMMCFQVDY